MHIPPPQPFNHHKCIKWWWYIWSNRQPLRRSLGLVNRLKLKFCHSHQSRGGNGVAHWDFCLTTVGIIDRVAASDNKCKNNSTIWRGSFLSSVLPWPSFSPSPGSLSTRFHLAQWWANGSLWQHWTFSPFSLLINVLPVQVVCWCF